MKQNLEENVNQDIKEPWLKRAFKKEWPTIGNHLIACGVSIGAATGFSYIAPRILDSDAAISGIATALDTVGYWGAILPQFLYRDRKKLRDVEGNLDKIKIKKKIGEYLGVMGAMEGIYILGRFVGQYILQKQGVDPATASASIQMGAIVAFTFMLPPIRYTLGQWSEKE